MPLFKNSQELGSFGEFCYQKFALEKQLQIEKRGILEYDFFVDGGKKIDVKSTQSSATKYSGKRVRDDISYDVISVVGNIVTIYPDSNSPLHHYFGYQIGDVDSLYCQWQSYRDDKKARIKKDNPHQLKRREIKKQIEKICPTKKIRIIYRGSVSKTRWRSSPDNIPGGEKVLKDYQLTVFVQMITSGDDESISRIYLFDHALITKFKMMSPDSRQLQKGVKEVIDFEWFDHNYPQYIFTSLDSLNVYLGTYT